MPANTVKPVTLVILGASGDLTHRLLLPGLGTLLNLHPDYHVTLIGAAVEDITDEEWNKRVREALGEAMCRQEKIDAVATHTRYVRTDVTNTEELRALISDLPENSVMYFALPPAITEKAIVAMADVTLPAGLKLALEKPFGTSLESARVLNQELAALVPEQQIYRVDHFLGKATVLNLFGLRFTNRVLEPVWNAQNIDRVVIAADETLALEGRAGYYDHNGALRDMIQSHLLQVLAMFAMEQPASLDEREVRDLISHTLRATQLWDGDPKTSSRRARYKAGHIGNRAVPSYVDEPGVDPARNTETLAEIDLRICNARWHNVKFTLRSGKALGDMRNGMSVAFKPVEYVPGGLENKPPLNVLWIGMKPQNMYLQLSTNSAGDKFDLEPTVLSGEVDDGPLRPYGEILNEIFRGDPILSVRGDVAEECWRIVGPVLESWANNEVPLEEYAAGWAGPTAWA